MLKVTLKIRKIGKIGCIVTHHKFVLKLLKTIVFSKNCFGKRKESSKGRCVTVEVKGEK